MRGRILLLLLAITLTADAKTVLLEQVPLQWKPTSELKLGAMQMTQASIQFGTFQDARDDKASIGQNLENDDKPKPVTTSDDVGAFVGKHVRELFDHVGIKTVDSNGDVTLSGEVK